jgi:hypothetical protein
MRWILLIALTSIVIILGSLSATAEPGDAEAAPTATPRVDIFCRPCNPYA